ncbi:Myb/SANT-like DNA-binding domain-containing protein 3 [Lucilia cuprina]|nr:Myb/SANT-like DNA-binding domain-containing protein 3 [Lucilia cuprina]
MSQNNEKRQRGKNFSLNEEYLLVDLVEIYKSVLENKKSDAVTWRQKNETWEKLASEFASQSGVQRTWKALRDKYENLKRKSKLEKATEKRETYRTGGGPTATSIVSNISEKISCLIGESATGFCNPYDNDGNGMIIISIFSRWICIPVKLLSN